MSIRWDALLTRHVARELDQRLAGGRLRAIRFDGSTRDAVLFFRDCTLVWRLHPTRGVFRLLPPTDPGPDDLRLATRLRSVTAPPDERIIVFRLLPVRGRAKARDLVVELLGNQWNCIVAEGEDRILRHVLHTRSGTRVLRVGQPYVPPPPSERMGIDGSLDRDTWVSVVAHGQHEHGHDSDDPGHGEDEQGRGPGRQGQRREMRGQSPALVSRIAWTSPLVRDALLAEDAQTPDGDPRGLALWRRWVAPDAPTQAVVLRLKRGDQPYPFPLNRVEMEPATSLVAAFELCAARQEALEASQETLFDPALFRRLERAVEVAQRRATKLVAALNEIEDADQLRSLGDLILARYHEMETDGGKAHLLDFSGQRVTIEIEPGEAPHQSAGRYYARAGKSERARERLPALIRASATELEALTSLLERVRAGEVESAEVVAALPAEVARKSGPQGPSLPYRRYRSSGGIEIRVGRGARHNDDLTFRHSAPSDVWLHARHTAGAHVILRWSGPGNPPSRDLEEAAILAALHSKARTSGSAPVDWTLRKHVRKPRGSAPGAVLPDRVKTVFVEPDPTLTEKLAE